MPETNEPDSPCCTSCFLCSCCSNYKRMPEKAETTASKPPFCMELPKRLVEGTSVQIQGSIDKNTSNFGINFTTSKDNGDIAFHLKPRLQEHYIARNHKVNNQWGVEESTSIRKFNPGDFYNRIFKIVILLGDKEFLVSVNNLYVCSFKFRIPLAKVRFLEIYSCVNVKSVEFGNLTRFPEEPRADVQKAIIRVGDFASSSDANLPLPVTATLPAKFEPGWQVTISGRVKLLPQSFFINLQDGHQIWPHPNIPLHINPRFNVTPGQDVLVRNAWFSGSWGPEERCPSFPFSPNEEFSVTIVAEVDAFAVWVNNLLTGEFRFRHYSIVNTVYVQGDVVVHHVTMGKHLTEVFVNRES